ncbi:MAG TPA: DUF4905 domain-containing protein [Ignavibacteriaceae bacterium]|nr:DUF4905 domain-containing protein [Ignavibacteriaceae bacterium]
MKVKKKYSFTNNRTIWRLLPSADKLLIEERDDGNKQVFFSVINIGTGKKILSEFQLDEKFWVGIEAFENDIIFFHRFIKPDMPGHFGITAYSLDAKDILWNREDLVFLFLAGEHVFAFRQNFDSRDFFSLNASTGNIVKEYGEDIKEINRLREKLLSDQYEKFKGYFFPEIYVPARISARTEELINDKKKNEIISGSIEYAEKEGVLFLSYHTIEDEGKFKNNFNIIDINSGKIILEVLLNRGITSYIPDSFFVKDDLLFLIRDKIELEVYSLG